MTAVLDGQPATESSFEEEQSLIDLDKLWHEDAQWDEDMLHIEDDSDAELDRAISSYLALDLIDDRARRWLLS